MISSMTIAEKLRFLADRTEDGKEFEVYYHSDRKWITITQRELGSKIRLANADYITNMRIKTPVTSPQWEFTEDEKVILRNLPDEYRWIARNESDKLYFYTIKPNRARGRWTYGVGEVTNLEPFNHLFQCIQWSDTKPCEFRKYL